MKRLPHLAFTALLMAVAAAAAAAQTMPATPSAASDTTSAKPLVRSNIFIFEGAYITCERGGTHPTPRPEGAPGLPHLAAGYMQPCGVTSTTVDMALALQSEGTVSYRLSTVPLRLSAKTLSNDPTAVHRHLPAGEVLHERVGGLMPGTDYLLYVAGGDASGALSEVKEYRFRTTEL